jgi:hypothetical protein
MLDGDLVNLLDAVVAEPGAQPSPAWRSQLATEWENGMLPLRYPSEMKSFARGISLLGRPAQRLLRHLTPLFEHPPATATNAVSAALCALVAAGDLHDVRRHLGSGLAHLDRHERPDRNLVAVSNWRRALRERCAETPSDRQSLMAAARLHEGLPQSHCSGRAVAFVLGDPTQTAWATSLATNRIPAYGFYRGTDSLTIGPLRDQLLLGWATAVVGEDPGAICNHPPILEAVMAMAMNGTLSGGAFIQEVADEAGAVLGRIASRP